MGTLNLIMTPTAGGLECETDSLTGGILKMFPPSPALATAFRLSDAEEYVHHLFSTHMHAHTSIAICHSLLCHNWILPCLSVISIPVHTHVA